MKNIVQKETDVEFKLFCPAGFFLAGGNEFAEGGHGADSLNTNITCIQCNSESISERLSAKDG